MKGIVHRPSGAMAVAITALVVALGGTAAAASHLVSGNSLIKKNSLSGNRLRNGTLTGKQINLTKLGTVPSATSASTAVNATNAVNAKNATTAATAANATTAANALDLGGIPASGYTRSSCSSNTGQIKGFAFVAASTTFPSTLTALSSGLEYNCSGEAVEASRVALGQYEVKFLGSTSTLAYGNAIQAVSGGGIHFNDVVTFENIGPGDFYVWVTDTYPPSALIDDSFDIELL